MRTFGSRISRSYPLVSIFIWSGLCPLTYVFWRWFYPGDHTLPVLSGVTFLFAGTFNTLLVVNALYVERSFRNDPPLWRTRYCLSMTFYWFVSQSIFLGTELPSEEAVAHLGTGLIFGGLMARFVRHDDMVIWDKVFDLERPFWTTQPGSQIITYQGFLVFGLVLLAALFAPTTALGIFFVTPMLLSMLPLGVKNQTLLRERYLVAVAGVALPVLALLTPV